VSDIAAKVAENRRFESVGHCRFFTKLLHFFHKRAIILKT